eukprot:s2531_g5.t1
MTSELQNDETPSWQDEEIVVLQLEQRASKNDARVKALESLTRSSCDMLLELSERFIICDSSPLHSVFFCQEVTPGVPFIFTVPEVEQIRLSDFLQQASTKQHLMSACFTLPRGSAKLSVEYVSSYAALPHYLVAIHLQDPVEKARLVKDMAICFADAESSRSFARQEVCSPTSSKTTMMDIPIPEEGCVGRDKLTRDQEANMTNMMSTFSHTFSALARVPSSSFISASPRTSLASSHLQEPDQKRRGWSVRPKPKKNSPMNSLPQVEDFGLFGRDLEPRRTGTGSSLQFSHSVMSMRLEWEEVPDLPASPVVRTAEKEIQADLSATPELVSQTVQTQFTWRLVSRAFLKRDWWVSIP